MKRIALALGALTILFRGLCTRGRPELAAEPETSALFPTPDTKPAAAPVPGANSFTEDQAKERIEGKGYRT